MTFLRLLTDAFESKKWTPVGLTGLDIKKQSDSRRCCSTTAWNLVSTPTRRIQLSHTLSSESPTNQKLFRTMSFSTPLSSVPNRLPHWGLSSKCQNASQARANDYEDIPIIDNLGTGCNNNERRAGGVRWTGDMDVTVPEGITLRMGIETQEEGALDRKSGNGVGECHRTKRNAAWRNTAVGARQYWWVAHQILDGDARALKARWGTAAREVLAPAAMRGWVQTWEERRKGRGNARNGSFVCLLFASAKYWSDPTWRATSTLQYNTSSCGLISQRGSEYEGRVGKYKNARHKLLPLSTLPGTKFELEFEVDSGLEIGAETAVPTAIDSVRHVLSRAGRVTASLKPGEWTEGTRKTPHPHARLLRGERTQGFLRGSKAYIQFDDAEKMTMMGAWEWGQLAYHPKRFEFPDIRFTSDHNLTRPQQTDIASSSLKMMLSDESHRYFVAYILKRLDFPGIFFTSGHNPARPAIFGNNFLRACDVLIDIHGDIPSPNRAYSAIAHPSSCSIAAPSHLAPRTMGTRPGPRVTLASTDFQSRLGTGNRFEISRAPRKLGLGAVHQIPPDISVIRDIVGPSLANRGFLFGHEGRSDFGRGKHKFDLGSDSDPLFSAYNGWEDVPREARVDQV
ncbi:hypothetical protein BD779DRAFT_1477635 [Infundibulicybe gibba]|nr:hypothetical protein BD779DRAFT_1477635 [Infundibulicybe gibba]